MSQVEQKPVEDIHHLEQTPSYPEKGGVEHIEDIDPAFEKRTMRKVDIRLLPILGSLYAISLIDRTNISLARVAGMLGDLKLAVGERYSIISLLFFVPYIIFELPSNIVARRLGVANWLTFIVVSWGIVTIGMAFCKTWTDLLVCRVLLGLLEAGFFPACAFVISCWYKRLETSTRMSAFYIISNIISGFSAILAYGLSTLKGKAGLAGWRWIFLVEGLLTVGLGILGWFLIVDFPDKATFLSHEESALVRERIQRERGDAEYVEVSWASFKSSLADIKLWMYATMFMCSTCPSYVVAYFGPVILATMGYSVRDSQLLVAPLYVVAATFAIIMAIMSDRLGIRSPFVCISSTCTLVGLCVVGYTVAPKIRYFGLFLTLMGCMSNVPATIAWMNNNLVGSAKKSVGNALTISFGGIGGIVATTVFRQQDYPRYIPGVLTVIALQVLMIVISLSLAFYYAGQNKLARDGKKLIEGRQGYVYIL